MRILWIKTSPLHPLTRGGDLRTFHLLKCLHQRHEVVYAGLLAGATQYEAAKKASEYSSVAHWISHPAAGAGKGRFLTGAMWNLLASRLPYAVSRFQSRAWRSKLGEILHHRSFDLVVCDFLFPAASLPWDRYQTGSPPAWVLFQHNVEAVIWERRAEGRSGVFAPYWRSQALRMRRFEESSCRKFDAVLTVSDADTRTHRDKYRLQNVVGAVPAGVDVTFFQQTPRQLAETPAIVFVGSMDWHANVDAVHWFAREIWPRVRAMLPRARFQIVGREPPPSVVGLVSDESGIEVTGTVADVRPYLRRAHATVVPLRIGGGTRLKIFEALAAEVPVVSTRIGAEGLPLQDGRHVLLADRPEDVASALVRLCSDTTFAARLADQAFHEVAMNHSWDAAARQFESYVGPLVSPGAL